MSAVESWFAPAAVAEPLASPRPRKRRRRAPAPKPKAQRRQRRSFRVRAPLVWMVVFAVLLVGVVAVNVAVLRANVSVNNLDTQIAQRQQEIATLKSQYARATAAPRVEAAARRAGLIPASSAQTDPPRHGERQVSRVRARLVNQRLRLLFLLILLTFGALAARTAYLQTVRASSLAAAATAQTRTTVTTPALRGTISDRIGTPLAIGAASDRRDRGSRCRSSAPAQEARIAAKVLGIRYRPLLKALSDRTSQYVLVARKASPAKAAVLQSEESHRASRSRPNQRRVVPAGDGRGAGARLHGRRRAARRASKPR